MDCPSCGSTEIAIRLERDGVRSYVVSKGEPYDFEHRYKEKKSLLGSDLSPLELAVLRVEVAWEDLNANLRDVVTEWSDAVDLMVDLLSEGSDHAGDLAPWILRFLCVDDEDVRFDTMRAAAGLKPATNVSRPVAVKVKNEKKPSKKDRIVARKAEHKAKRR